MYPQWGDARRAPGRPVVVRGRLPDDDPGSRVHAIAQLGAEATDEDLRAHIAGRPVRQ
ncbi:hypothetical protein ACL02T_06245 [Pseudonocardia sp. RS010]|uniref:hypothetical protein n=1 Tax=Pseudonocardia sp. RS010 TaxID=3385979 RepID=UPI00399F7F94